MATRKNTNEAMRQMADRVMAGEITREQGSALLGLSASRLSVWMRCHGYPRGKSSQPMQPTERDLKALREYWRRECNTTELMEFTGRSYPVVKRWINEGLGKDY